MAESCVVNILPGELQLSILDLLSALDARRAATVCRSWRDVVAQLDTSLCLVTASGDNEVVLLDGRGRVVQRIKAKPVPRKRGGRMIHPVVLKRWTTWPTCIATGPRGDLFVSQYKVQGILQFVRTPIGYEYRRTLASGSRFASPEGIVFAHDSIYLVCVDSGTIARLSMSGQLLEVSKPFERTNDYGELEFFVMWGMCINDGPHGDGHLYIAAHVGEEGNDDYERPTAVDTGGILRQRLRPDGSFDGDTEGFAGYPMAQTFVQPNCAYVDLNRPSEPSVCEHGFLHVSSFVSSGQHGLPVPRHGNARRVYKFSTELSVLPGNAWARVGCGGDSARGLCYGWLETSDDEDAELLKAPWGVSCAPSGVLLTCHGVDVPVPVVKLGSCGCAGLRCDPSAPRNAMWKGLDCSHLPTSFSNDPFVFRCEAKPFTRAPMNQANAVEHIVR